LLAPSGVGALEREEPIGARVEAQEPRQIGILGLDRDRRAPGLRDPLKSPRTPP
jgi:hypothetical protein